MQRPLGGGVILRVRALSSTAVLTAAIIVACSPASRQRAQSSQASQTTVSSFDLGDPGGTRRNAEPFTPDPPDFDDPNHPGNRLAAAACDRKLECDQVGVGKTLSTQQACLMAARRHAHEDLDRARCENGIDDARLSECIHVVRVGACSSDFVMAGRFTECRGEHLCAR